MIDLFMSFLWMLGAGAAALAICAALLVILVGLGQIFLNFLENLK